MAFSFSLRVPSIFQCHVIVEQTPNQFLSS